jgi:DNA-directed RNA polymerase specialized sigma24 family protein
VRLRAGEHSILRELLERDHPVAVFFAHALGGADVADSVVDTAWEGLLADVVNGEVTDRLRAALLSRVAAALGVADSIAQPAVAQPLGTFTPEGDRWEGWWADERAPWPDNTVPEPEQVLRALSRIPVKPRAALVLRDVARLTASEVAEVLAVVRPVVTLLDSARDAYLVEIDREVISA